MLLCAIQKVFNLILDAIFPKTCFGCAGQGSYFCVVCITTTPRQIKQRCIVCQKPSLLGLTHPKCSNTITPDKLTTIFNYNTFPIKNLIIAGKYQFVREIFIIFAQILCNEIKLENNFIVCDIPLSNKRRRWRGFNQTTIMAQKFAQAKAVGYLSLLVRKKNTRVQKDLSKPHRALNLRNAFQIQPAITLSEQVIIFDDVITTGTTFLEATKVLKKAGVKYVWCIAIAQD